MSDKVDEPTKEEALVANTLVAYAGKRVDPVVLARIILSEIFVSRSETAVMLADEVARDRRALIAGGYPRSGPQVDLANRVEESLRALASPEDRLLAPALSRWIAETRAAGDICLAAGAEGKSYELGRGDALHEDAGEIEDILTPKVVVVA